MNRKIGQRVEQLDREISCLQTTFAELSKAPLKTENGTVDFALIHEKSALKKRILQQRTVLNVLLQDQPRPWYFYRLPSEVLEKIFQWIIDPVDQLHVLQIFPTLGPLMYWDIGTRYFQQIYPHVAPYLWPDWRDVWRLCQVSRDFMDVILDHLKGGLSESSGHDFNFEEYSTETQVASLLEECDELGREEWMADMPFLVSPYIAMTWNMEHARAPEFARRFLEAHGDKVWTCKIVLNTMIFTELLLENLHWILRKIPKVVSLNFRYANLGGFDMQDRQWPTLPCLRSLHSYNSPYNFAMFRYYGPQLKFLKTDKAPRFAPDYARFPLLEHYSTSNFRAFGDFMFEAPLKTFSLELGEPGDTRRIMTTLTHFANSLEEVTFRYDTTIAREWVDPLELEVEWMSEIWLPKLRHLELLCNVGSLDGLLTLPALETLRFFRAHDQASRGLLYLTPSAWNRATLSTNVWRHLQNLKRMDISWEEEDGWVTYTRPAHQT